VQANMLEVKNLKKYFPVKGLGFLRAKAFIKAVDGVDFTLDAGETLGLVGESGCGKSTLARLITGLIRPTEGHIYFEGSNISDMTRSGLRRVRRDIQLVFQDPYASLNPRMTAGDIIGEPLKIHRLARDQDREDRLRELFELVGLEPRHMGRYPHQFSGGQRQRIGIARALAVSPRLIVCDEPVSALDVSAQAQIINLMLDLKQRLGLTYLFIAHHLGVIGHISDRVAVMYMGRIVEIAYRDRLFDSPMHPYTKALLSAAPADHPKQRKERSILAEEVPGPGHSEVGCRYKNRCPRAVPLCGETEPALVDLGEGHFCACHLRYEW
jgi:oligopeptide transport system ATP-binding protein